MSVIIPPVHELTIVGIFDPGVPHKERIVLRPTEIVNLAHFCLMLGIQGQDGSFTPIQDSFFWMGALVVGPPSWLVVYTDPGQPVTTKHPQTDEPLYIGHWGRNQTVFGLPGYDLAVGVARLGSFSSWLAPKVDPANVLTARINRQ